MKNISDVHNCYGCGVCSIACAKKIIDLHLNSEGFYEPYLTDLDKCTDCGLCREVCAFLHDQKCTDGKVVASFGAWSNDEKVRRKCSSGGVGYEIAKVLMQYGYKACVVRYNAEKERVEHYISDTEENLISSTGSKYLQSYTVEAFKFINRKEKYLITGTPCQIDSFRRYAKVFRCEDNFVFLDFFCHGVPSMAMWEKYKKYVEDKVGRLTYVSWRNKYKGWHDSWAMGIEGINSCRNTEIANSLDEKHCDYESLRSKGDFFYRLFIGDCCLGKQCYNHCKYKYDKSSADIRIGDMWGKTYVKDEDGVSAVACFTERGNTILKLANCKLTEHTFDVIAEGQMKESPKVKFWFRYIMDSILNGDTDINKIIKQYNRFKKMDSLINHMKHPIRSMFILFGK